LLPEQIYEIFKGRKVSEDVFIFFTFKKRFCLLFFHSTLKITRDLGVQKLNFDFKIGFFHHGLASKVVNLLGVLDPPDFHITFGAVVTLGGFMSEKVKKNLQLIFVACSYRLSDYWNLLHTRVSKGRDVPRDVPGQIGTGRPVVPLSRDKKVSLSRCPFVPGQKSFVCPAVPLSRDKGKSKNPGTNTSVPGRPGTK
jgi:hypothetical protein